MTTIASRGWTAARWTSENPVLPIGEIGIEHDTGYAKRGNGATAWTSLDYWDPNGGQINGRHAGRPSLRGATGEYWAFPVARTITILADGVLYTHAVYVPFQVVIDRIGAEVTTGAGSSTLTLGYYADDGAGKPTGAALFDAGTIDGNSATAQEITVGRRLAARQVYHLAALCAGGTPSVRTSSNGAALFGRYASLATATQNTPVAGWSQTGVVGTSLPTIGTLVPITTVPIVAVRLA